MLFDIKGREFIVIDVGGQRSERRKWIHQFENVNAIIFFAALDEYDMRLEEDSRTNCLEESLQLFSEVRQSQIQSQIHGSCSFVDRQILNIHTSSLDLNFSLTRRI